MTRTNTDMRQIVTEKPITIVTSQTPQDRHLALAQQWESLVSAHGLDYPPARALQTEMREIRRQLNPSAALKLDADTKRPTTKPSNKRSKGVSSSRPSADKPRHEKADEILDAYMSGLTPYAIGQIFGIDHRQIARILVQCGAELRPAKHDYDALVRQVREMFPGAIPSVPVIVKLLGVGEFVARNVRERL